MTESGENWKSFKDWQKQQYEEAEKIKKWVEKKYEEKHPTIETWENE